uniref:Uncharacterized protein n=1 Tax=Anguilla anguilla TaxID=7936 RepID=A0A0E9XRA3_ANGAN
MDRIIYMLCTASQVKHTQAIFFLFKNKKKINSYMEVHSSTILFLPLAKAQFLKPRGPTRRVASHSLIPVHQWHGKGVL